MEEIPPYKQRALPTQEESYAEGFKTGAAWTSNYRPGGPWVCSPGNRSGEEFIQHCAAMALNNKQWLQGWDDGQKAKHGNY